MLNKQTKQKQGTKHPGSMGYYEKNQNLWIIGIVEVEETQVKDTEIFQ